eukprot:Seg1700.7 transcript_id=Seg1700.7/GoldUCD/mRNA.D3Y31 product="Tetratricopeptide repeat protein 31" protein_id=Seg1700.7/GoldUCD/D3Y31
MKITKSQACQILGVSEGASEEEIRRSYKDLARKWHPDKQDGSVGSDEATEKFQEVSAAYKKLTSNEKDYDDDDGMTLGEMMELYRQLFSFRNPMGQCNCRHHHHHYRYNNEDMSDYDDYDYTDDEDSDEEFWESIASRLRSKYEARKYMPKDSTDTPRSGITEEEALRNAQELIEEEEIEKRRKEKKKAKKKKKKEKRKQKEKEKENPEDEDKNIGKEDIKNLVLEKEEKSKSENKDIHLPNGHPPSMKNSMKNATNTKNNKKQQEYIEKIQKPVKRVIVQEDIRPSIPKDTKEEKGARQGKDTRHSKGKDGSDDEEQFDASSAFFARAASKAPQTQATTYPPPKEPEPKPPKNNNTKKNAAPKNKETKKSGSKLKEKKEENHKLELKSESAEKEIKNTKSQPEVAEKENQDMNQSLDSVIIKSRQLAVKGNEFAAREEYLEAIGMFSEAIHLDPSDFRFFGNRSYCYDRTGQFQNALRDAESAVRLAAQWPKGYFRKGRALTGLERYQEAEEAFQNVLTLDSECPDAQFELEKVRVRILTDMGFQRPLAEESVRTHGTVQSALEALLAGNVTPRSDGEEKQCTSDSDDSSGKRNGIGEKGPILVTTSSQPKIKQKCSALWIGNVNSHTVTEKQLSQLFSKQGKLVSVRLLPEKYCAFINYQMPEGAAKALEKLQGHEIGGQNLLIRYPNNPPPGSMVVPNTAPEKPTPSQAASKRSAEKQLAASKLTGPVNGNECYFWRTTGCVFDVHCRYRHIDDHKGVDLAKVQAKYGAHL